MERSCSDALRRLAKQAKNRLNGRKNGGYKIYGGEFLADYKLVQISSKEDERFYQKVSEILKENYDIINPLGKLVEIEKIANMSDIEKERYVITLADKYIKMKNRFEKERALEVEFAG